nr:reverse transcriptase domain-containing protein [Tanacetum cinerariifolium]
KNEYSLIQDIKETLSKLRRVNIKVDPNASTLEIDEGKFLRHMVTKEGVMADLEKVQEIIQSPVPKNVRMKLEAEEGSSWTGEAEEAF